MDEAPIFIRFTSIIDGNFQRKEYKGRIRVKTKRYDADIVYNTMNLSHEEVPDGDYIRMICSSVFRSSKMIPVRRLMI